MPKAALGSIRTGGGGLEAGNYEVVGAKFAIKKLDYEDAKKQLYQVLSVLTLDAEGDRVRDAEPIEIDLGFGPESIQTFHVGKGSGADDNDPKDLGTDIDVEGNTVWTPTPGVEFKGSCGASVFNTSLLKLGFSKEILDRTWAADLVGLKFALETLPAAEINKLLETRLSTKPNRQGGSFTYKIARKWLNPTYLSKTGAAGNAVAPPKSAPAEAMSADEILTECIARVAAKRKGPKNTIKSIQSLSGFCTNEFAAGKFKGVKISDFQARFANNDDAVKTACLEAGGELDMDDDGNWTGKVTFPA
jgi:hypothetical protein